MADLNPIIKQFPEVGEVQEIKALTSGLINQTYLVKTVDENEPNYVLQRINNNIFCDVDMLQHNIEVVTEHIRKKLYDHFLSLVVLLFFHYHNRTCITIA